MRILPGLRTSIRRAVCLLPCALIFLSGTAHAQGLTGGLEGLREAVFLFWGFCGIVPAVLLAIAFVREKKHPGSILALSFVLVSFLYALSAISLFFFESHEVASKFPGTIGFVVLFGVVRYLVRGKGLRIGVYCILGSIFVVLLIIPNEYWKIPPLSFERIVYVDNLAGFEKAGVLRTPYGYNGRLALDDGRLLIQTERIPKQARYAGQGSRATFSNGVVVVVDPVAFTKPGQWFEINHYDRTYVYGVRTNGQRARYVLPLSEKTVEMYRPSIKTLGYLVDEAAGVDYEDMLMQLMREDFGSWSAEPDRHDPGNKYHWARRLIEQGELDLNSPEVLDRAFGVTRSHALLALVDFGMSPIAQDSSGNTVLHVAAARPDFVLLNGLLERDIDPSIRNARGLTAVEVIREHAERAPGRYPIERFEELLAGRRIAE